MFVKIINDLVVDTVKSNSKFDFIIDSLLNEFNEGCPPSNRLEHIINQKRNIEESYKKVKKNIELLNNTTNKIENIINILKTTITIITSLPIPVSISPAPGVPVGYLMTFSNKLKESKDLLVANKNTLSVSGKVLNILKTSLSNIYNKIKNLDDKILNCLQSYLQSLSEEERNEFLNKNFNIVQEQEIINNNYSINQDNIFYKEYKIKIEYDQDNKFLVPKKRAIAIINNKKIFTDWSFTTNLENLIEEIKYKINEII